MPDNLGSLLLIYDLARDPLYDRHATMSDIRDIEITSKMGKDLLKEIRVGLPSLKLRSADSRGNREYEMVKSLDTIVKRLLEELKLAVRDDDV